MSRSGGSPATVAEYTYDGLGHRIGWHYDTDTDADADACGRWYWFAHDDRWRIVATLAHQISWATLRR